MLLLHIFSPRLFLPLTHVLLAIAIFLVDCTLNIYILILILILIMTVS